MRSAKSCDREKAEISTTIAAARTNSIAVAEKISRMMKKGARRYGEESQRVGVGYVNVKKSDDNCGMCDVVIIREVSCDGSLDLLQKLYGHVAKPCETASPTFRWASKT